MKSKGVLALALSVAGSTFLFAQTEAPRLPPGDVTARSVQAPLDPAYGLLTATCKNAPPARGGRGAGGNRGRGPAPAAGQRDYTVPDIAGVVKAGAKWKFIWQQAGNNGDGIVGLNDGSLLVVQNDSSDVLKLDAAGKTTVAFNNTRTGGAVSISPKGSTFIVERGLHQRVEQLTPTWKVHADTYNGDPIDCIGGVINDLTADSKGGVYFTMGGLFYADPAGKVTRYGENLTTNGIILSANEKTLYVTNGPAVAAFDVQKDGSLTNQREFAKLTSGGGDGSTIDAKGRLYVTTNGGIEVIGADGKNLGVIPTPRGAISCAFGGKDKKTLFALLRGGTDAQGADQANVAQVWSMQMTTQGYKGRAK
jgi:gluconolactonase